MPTKTSYLTARQAAFTLHVSLRTIQRWLADGAFPGALKFGDGAKSPYMIPRADIEAIKRARTKTVQAR